MDNQPNTLKMSGDSLLSWNRKAYILNMLSRLSLQINPAGDWYVSHNGVEVKEGEFLRSVSSLGATPQEAIEIYWDKITNIPSDHYVVLNSTSENKRRHVRWNGFMWEDIADSTDANKGESAQHAAPINSWQPIETAPRDGTSVILLINGVATEGYWEASKSFCDPYWSLVALNYDGYRTPTHWMLLPSKPPQAQEK